MKASATLENCGLIWLERSEYRKAADYFRRALELNPKPAGTRAGVDRAGEEAGERPHLKDSANGEQ